MANRPKKLIYSPYVNIKTGAVTTTPVATLIFEGTETPLFATNFEARPFQASINGQTIRGAYDDFRKKDSVTLRIGTRQLVRFETKTLNQLPLVYPGPRDGGDVRIVVKGQGAFSFQGV